LINFIKQVHIVDELRLSINWLISKIYEIKVNVNFRVKYIKNGKEL